MAEKTVEELLRERRTTSDLRRQEQNRTDLTATGPGVAMDVARSAGSGLAHGTAVGIPAAIGDTMELADQGWQHLLAWILEKTGQMTPEQAEGAVKPLPGLEQTGGRGPGGMFPTSQRLDPIYEGAVGKPYEPQTTPGKVTKTIAEMAPAAIMPGLAATRGATTAQQGARVGADLLKGAVLPGAAIEGTTQALEDADLSPAQKQALTLAAGAATGAAAHRTLAEPRAGVPLPGVHPGAVERVGRDITTAGGVEPVMREMDALGPGGMLADATPSLQGRAEGLGVRSNEPMIRAVRERHAQAGDRITEVLDDAFGSIPGQDYFQRTRELENARRQQANDLYGQWRAQVGNAHIVNDGIMGAIQRNISPSVERPGSNTAPGKIDSAMLQLRDQFRGRNDPQSLHQAKVDLDDRIEAARRTGENSLVRSYEQVRSAVVDALDSSARNANGESLYGRARRAFASDSAILDARNQGETLFSGAGSRNYTPQELAHDLHQMGEGERAAFLEGARNNIAMVMDNARIDATAATRLFQTNQNQAKLRVLQQWGQDGLRPGSADRIIQTLEGQRRQQGTHERVTANSATARRTEAVKDVPDPAPLPFKMRDAPNLSQLVTGLASKVGGAVANVHRERKANAINNDMARLLSSGPGLTRDQMTAQLREIMRAYGRPPGGVPTMIPAGISALYGARRADEEERR